MEKMKILDACCGNRTFWYNKKHPAVTYIDIKKDVDPDLIMDCRNTNFKEKTFDLIVFDPPHCSYSEKNKGLFKEKYGGYTSAGTRSFIKKSFIEFERILKKDGLVVFKWNTHCQKLNVILSMIKNFEVLFGHLTAYKTKHSSQTYWLLLKLKNSGPENQR